MTARFLYRTFRQAVFGGRPYFAHLAVTHRCNLRCRFCQITSSPYPELGLDDMKRVIDRLDRMGIAVLALTGGEPLLRPDLVAIIDYAAAKGLYVTVATNGTMPRARYAELVRSRVSEIGISLDGVRGSDIPYSHTGPGILRNIKFVNDNLPPGKRLRINITISETNYDEVQDIVRYCTAEFRNARLFLNPVVVGAGRLRKSTGRRVPADFLSRVDSPLVLLPDFYKRACETYSQSGRFDWGCRAGEAFFDIKPNGDLWICQDHPCLEHLNILDADFDVRYRHADFSNRRQCEGCTFSCYLMAQIAFAPRNWPDVARLWWTLTTRPDEACRETADRLGWVVGLLHFAWLRLAARGFGRGRARPTQALTAPDGGSESEDAADAIRRAVLLLGDDLVGLVAFGSWVRGEAATTSDVDLLVVVDAHRPLTRDLYRRWDEVPVTWGGRAVEPHFVHLPEPDSVAGGVWAEAAMDGVVHVERQHRVSRRLALVRRDILSGRLVRRLVHGQPYWTEVA